MPANQRKKTTRQLLFIFILFPVLFLFYISLYPALPDFRFGPDLRFSSKVIDPNVKDFNSANFQYDDYNNYADLLNVLVKIFPRGTDEKVILKSLEEGFGGRKAIEIQEIDGSYLSISAELPALDHKIYTRYKKIYPLRRCLFGFGGNADAIEYLFDVESRLMGIRIMNGCVTLGEVSGND